MRKNFLMQGLRFLCIALLLSGAAMQGAVWNNTIVAPGTNILDDDLDIIGDNSIQGDVRITADSVDILVSLTNGDAIVRGDTGAPASDPDPRLFLLPRNGHKITFDLTDSLSFFGASDGTPLLILVDTQDTGTGVVEFLLANGKTVEFSADGVGGGTKFFLKMYADQTQETITFIRADTTSSAHVFVVVGRDSMMSYVAETPVTASPDELGTILFDPTNTGAGRMILKVEDLGAVLIGGNLIDDIVTVTDTLLSNIYTPTLAGLSAKMLVTNSDAGAEHAGLLVVNENTVYTSLAYDMFCTGTFDGFRAGFILSSHASLEMEEGAYFDYVGATTNTCLDPNISGECLDGREVDEVVKFRNASAFIVDSDPTDTTLTGSIVFNTNSALFFRSGVDSEGNVSEFEADGSVSFTIDPEFKTSGIGNIVFDVEGRVDVIGLDDPDTNRVEILSLHVDPTGGPINYETPAAPFVFPLRDFNGTIYNSASFFINGRMNLFSATLAHTDENHTINQKNDCTSEPTYVGGDNFFIKQLTDGASRPKIVFYSSSFDLHTSAAVVGLDLFVPNFDGVGGNSSDFTFFHNGFVVDKGTGRNLILGSVIGADVCDGCATVSRDAHLDIYQETPQDTLTTHELQLLVAPNNCYIHATLPCDPTPIATQYSLHNIYLGWASNISIGTNGTTVDGEPLITFPTLLINGNYFSFDTRGGLDNMPENSSVTGQGGIFVDNHGIITIADGYRAMVSTMVTRSHGGTIDLPKNRVLFDVRVGIAEWNLDLTDAGQLEIVPTGSRLSDYTLNWLATQKDYEDWTPYTFDPYNPCEKEPVVAANLTSLPTVSGIVDQFQIKGSRIGDPAHLMVDCGWIKELIFLRGCNAGEAPTAVVALQDNGRVGLNMADTSNDSLSATMKLGVNGVTIIANGNGQVDLNSDLVIDNICSVLKGPDFGSEIPQVLTFFAATPKTIRVRPTGILDLSSFNSVDDTIRFEGSVKVIFEPGSRLIMGGATLQFYDNSSFIVEPYFGCQPLSYESVQSTDDRRVSILGTGTISLEDNALMEVSRLAYLGIETDVNCSVTLTDITLQLLDQAQVNIGQDFRVFGGVFQVGNTTNQVYGEEDTPASVNFTLIINGEDINFRMGSRAFVGFGVGMVKDDDTELPNEWLVDNLFNVDAVNLFIRDGSLVHNHIFDGADSRAALLAFGQIGTGYTFELDPINGEILGGGNIIALAPSEATPINPVVLAVDGGINERITGVSILSSSPLLTDIAGGYKEVPTMPADYMTTFSYFKVVDTGTAVNIRGVVGKKSDNSNGFRAGYVSEGRIGRDSEETVLNSNVQPGAQAEVVVSIGAAQFLFPADAPALGVAPVVFTIPQFGSDQRKL